MTELTNEERYQVRKLQMDVDKKALEVQKSQQELDRCLLELAHKYDLVAMESPIDPRTATILEDSPARNVKSRTAPLLTAEHGEAAA